MADELIKTMTASEITLLQYKGSGAARNDILAGQVQMMFDSISTAAPHIQNGQLRALATTGTTRSIALPNVPTMSEAGVAGYHATGWVGLVAPAKTPTSLIERINSEVVKIV